MVVAGQKARPTSFHLSWPSPISALFIVTPFEYEVFYAEKWDVLHGRSLAIRGDDQEHVFCLLYFAGETCLLKDIFSILHRLMQDDLTTKGRLLNGEESSQSQFTPVNSVALLWLTTDDFSSQRQTPKQERVKPISIYSFPYGWVSPCLITLANVRRFYYSPKETSEKKKSQVSLNQLLSVWTDLQLSYSS